MIRNLISLFMIGSLTSCFITPPASPTDCPLQDTIDALAALQASLEYPQHFRTENPKRTGEEFEVNQYFTILNHLSMEPGYILDYVYVYDFLGGYPVLYARPEGQAPYLTHKELTASPQASDLYLNHVQADGSEESYFEFVALRIMGQQFYLFWHANYNDTRIVCDSDALESILSETASFGKEMPLADQRRARSLDLTPRIQISEETVSVQIIIFTKWGGLYRQTYTLQRQFPHTILNIEQEQLVAYNCGIRF